MVFDIVVISGFSGSGKGTILKELMALNPELELIKSYTTRSRRNASDYYSFVSITDFLMRKEKGYFLECNKYSGEWYGTPIHDVANCIAQGRTAIVEVDSNGYRQIIESSFAKKVKILSVFIVADADTIITRLLNRNTESPEKILKRVKTSLSECEQIAYYDLILPNYDLHTSVKLLENAIFNGMLPQLDFDVDKYKVRMKKIIWLLDA